MSTIYKGANIKGTDLSHPGNLRNVLDRFVKEIVV